MAMKVLFLNCTLKKPPVISNTCALIDESEAIFKEHSVESEIIRIVDKVVFGVFSDERGGNEWPLILEKITACDIPIIAFPIWFRVRSSVTRMVIERLDGTYVERKPQTGQYALYGKVAGVIVTGNEDGAHNVAGTTRFNRKYLAKLLKENSIPTNLKKLDEGAKKVSD